ncbi:phosphorylase family protein [Streptomyces aurantiogriseus]
MPGTPWTVAIAELGEGALTAAALTTRIVSELHPEALLFVGVAGGLKDDLEIGDVVVGTKVYAIHGGKEAADGFLARPEAWRGSHRLLRRPVRRCGAWTACGGTANPSPAGTSSSPTSAPRCGGVSSGRTTTRTPSRWRAGSVHAAHLSGQLDALVIRGISDLADAQKADADAAACRNSPPRRPRRSRWPSCASTDRVCRVRLLRHRGGPPVRRRPHRLPGQHLQRHRHRKDRRATVGPRSAAGPRAAAARATNRPLGLTGR